MAYLGEGHLANMASRDIFSVLAVPNFRWLWIGSLGSSFAMNMQIIARGWFVYDLTSSAMDLAWVTLSFMLPSVLFSLYGGVLADRLPKRRLIVVAQSLNALATLSHGMDYIFRHGGVLGLHLVWLFQWHDFGAVHAGASGVCA